MIDENIVCCARRYSAVANDCNQQTFVVAVTVGWYELAQWLSVQLRELVRHHSQVALQRTTNTKCPQQHTHMFWYRSQHQFQGIITTESDGIGVTRLVPTVAITSNAVARWHARESSAKRSFNWLNTKLMILWHSRFMQLKKLKLCVSLKHEIGW